MREGGRGFQEEVPQSESYVDGKQSGTQGQEDGEYETSDLTTTNERGQQDVQKGFQYPLAIQGVAGNYVQQHQGTSEREKVPAHEKNES